MTKHLFALVLLFSTPVLADQYIRPDNEITINWDSCSACIDACLGDDMDSTTCNTDTSSPGDLYDADADTNGVDPVVHTGHYLYARCKKGTGPGTPFIRVQIEDASYGTIANSGNYAIGTGTLTTYLVYTLSEAEAANITSYTTLDFEIYGGSSGNADVICAEVWLQIPDAGTPSARRRVF